MLIGTPPQAANLLFLELLEIGSNRAPRFTQCPGQVPLPEEQASGASLGPQRDMDEQLEGPIGEFLQGGLPVGGGGKPTAVALDL